MTFQGLASHLIRLMKIIVSLTLLPSSTLVQYLCVECKSFGSRFRDLWRYTIIIIIAVLVYEEYKNYDVAATRKSANLIPGQFFSELKNAWY